MDAVIVGDGQLGSGPAATTSVDVHVDLGKVPPTADAGGPYVGDLHAGATLDGRGSRAALLDPAQCSAQIVNYAWTVDGAPVTSGATASTPTLSAAQVDAIGHRHAYGAAGRHRLARVVVLHFERGVDHL